VNTADKAVNIDSTGANKEIVRAQTVKIVPAQTISNPEMF